jgi:OmpA-OmpF porin, OOP family
MRQLRTVAVGVIVVFLASGCALRDRKWGSCAIGGAILGAAAGGIAGGVTMNNAKDHPSNGDRGAAIGGGIAGGGLIGALLGHAICDPERDAPPPPPVPPPPAPRKAEPLVTLHGAQFDFNKATLKPAAKPVLDEAVKVMKNKPDLKVSVEGHTDSIGGAAYNQKLSERRAASVRDYLVSQGIDAARISVRGFGKSNPVASNDTEEGRAENRRVEVLPR